MFLTLVLVSVIKIMVNYVLKNFSKTLPDEALMDVLIEFVFTDFPKYDVCPLFNNN